jgi:peptidoglycan hydrolase CwlO-like protein
VALCEEHSGIVRSLGNIEGKLDSTLAGIDRLDKRINGTFKQISDHISESPEYRGKIMAIEAEIRNIKTEKLNSIKASQWRIGLIVSLGTTLLMVIMKVIFKV